jgi:hypothetical protein
MGKAFMRVFVAWAVANGMSPASAIFTLIMLVILWMAGVVWLAQHDNPYW